MVRLSERKELGTWAEKLFAEHLTKLGFCVHGEYTGTYGDPDVVAEKGDLKLAFEVKLARLWHGRHIGRIRIHRIEWDHLVYFCDNNGYKPMLGVVIKPARRKPTRAKQRVTDPILFYINGNKITERIIERKPRTATSLTTYQILSYGDKLENISSIMFSPNKRE